MTVNVGRQHVGAILSSAKSLYVSGCAAEIVDAPRLFRKHRLTNAVVTGIFSPLVNRRSYADPELGLRVRSFFLTDELKKHFAAGMVDYCPWRYGTIDRWLRAPGRFDTALVMVSPPDRNGRCSLGVQTDFLPNFHHKIDRLVGFINPNMPRTAGVDPIDYASLATVVDYDVPLHSLIPRSSDPVSEAIAKSISELIPDNATLQFGIGQIPSQVIARLTNHKGLRIHSGMIDDNILKLEESGALDLDAPIVTGNAMGSTNLYHALAENTRFSFKPTSYTHSQKTLIALKRFIAINSVLQVDLFGQVSAEVSGGKFVGSPGGLPDFTRGALASEDGQSIIAVRANGRGDRPSGIVSLLERPHAVTGTATDADIIVTEFGVAHVRNLSLDRRAEAIIAIAHPEVRESLSNDWAWIRQSFRTHV